VYLGAKRRYINTLPFLSFSFTPVVHSDMDTHTYQQFLQLTDGLDLGLHLVCAYHSVLVLFAFVVLI